MIARKIMSTPVVTVSRTATIQEAARMLAKFGYTALPVVDEQTGALLGLVTEQDLLGDAVEAVTANKQPHSLGMTRTVHDVLTTPVYSVQADTDVRFIAAAMRDKNIRSVPIMDGYSLIGIVTRRDIIAVLTRDDEELLRDLRSRLARYRGTHEWKTTVRNGVATIAGEFSDDADRNVAHVLASSVPGVCAVHLQNVQTTLDAGGHGAAPPRHPNSISSAGARANGRGR